VLDSLMSLKSSFESLKSSAISELLPECRM
jgi:hypothetical protein